MRIARNDERQAAAALGGPALFRLVRFWSRRWLRDDHQAPDDHALDILVLEAVDAALRRGKASVGDVATQLGIDRSGASRLIGSAVARGYVSRRAQESDARRAEVTVTRRGRALLSAARRWQSVTFLELVSDWDPDDVSAFARYLARLAERVLTQPPVDKANDN